MKIRDRLLRAEYSEEEIDRMLESEYNRRVELLPKPKTFFDTKVGKFLSTDWIDYLANKLINYEFNRLQKKEREKNMIEFVPPTLDKNEAWEVYEYYASHNIMQKETIDHGNGKFTHIYHDGLEVNVTTILSSFITDKMIEENEIFRRELLADYLNLPSEVVIKMNDQELEELVLKNELKNKKVKRKILTKK
jgi:hypothetical protein